jgi:hypothetical protein
MVLKAFGLGQLLVAARQVLGAELVRRDAGANPVEPIQGGLGGRVAVEGIAAALPDEGLAVVAW